MPEVKFQLRRPPTHGLGALIDNVRSGGRDPRFRRCVKWSTFLHLLLIFGPLILARFGCSDEYLIPGGGGQPKQVAKKKKQIKIQKRKKKYIVNPFSPILLNMPEDIKIDLQKETAEIYQAQVGGKGEGKGAGFAGGSKFGQIRFIRLQYNSNTDNWARNMGKNADYMLLLEFNKRTQIPVSLMTEAKTAYQLKLFKPNRKPPFIYVVGNGPIYLNNDEKEILKDYLLNEGGMLICDDAGAFDSHLQGLLRSMFPDKPLVDIPNDDDIYTQPYQLDDGAPPLWAHSGRRALGIKHDNRWIVFYHRGDMGDAWKEGHSGASPEVVEEAYKLGVNLIQYAIVKYMEHLQGNGGG